ncbi:hypothetical protein [Rhizobium sp. WYCCWR 11146]|uniref:hypothetical protein n=1 Tax=Rhizobium sp. WYCCWR 11146 TaxID=2749833 RepID=UPI0015E7B9FC|nr:hypothetical protein [Rhizobium sp. WYCCWR 11146]MBA1343936.1 hypothetical protein [Rhizobium sp. WYCCWR 11146]
MLMRLKMACRLSARLLGLMTLPIVLSACGDDKPKSPYDTSYELCMSYPATRAMPQDEQVGHCHEVAYNLVYGTGTTTETKPVDPREQSNTNAFNLCRAIDGMGDAAEPCRVSGRDVVVVMPMNPVEAKKFCLGAASEMQKAGGRFEPGWTLRITSPYSNGNNTASCEL